MIYSPLSRSVLFVVRSLELAFPSKQGAMDPLVVFLLSRFIAIENFHEKSSQKCGARVSYVFN